MMRRCYPHTSDPAIVKARRGAAFARSIAATAVVCGIAAMSLWAPQAAAQVMRDESCPAFAVDHASFASCDGDRVARRAAVTHIDVAAAREMKQRHGPAVLFIDVRSRAEAALRGTPTDVDYVVPYREIAQPVRWDAGRQSLALQANPGFVDQMQRAALAQTTALATPVLLLCATGNRATNAAEELRKAGFTEIYVVKGGVDGAVGWRAAGLPMLAAADEQQLFGLAE